MSARHTGLYPRHLTGRLLDALSDTPVVLLHGARQAGKSTLAQQITRKAHPAEYLTFDDAGILAAARRDPAGFVDNLTGPVVIDEVQRAPELFVAIKASVDRNRQPGRFLLTGSANLQLIPQLSESLAGRMEILTLYPLSQGEIEGVKEGLVDLLFADEPIPIRREPVDRADVVRRVIAGGYPEALARAPKRRGAWFGSYITTILQRDIRELQQVERLTEVPTLLSVLASRTGTVLNVADISRTTGFPQRTLARYLTLLQTTFLIDLIPAWTANVHKRLLKSPKVVMDDTGLVAHLLGMDFRGLSLESELAGQLLETFVVMELRKQIAWNETQAKPYHFRTASGEEVDVVLEAPNRRVVGVEVKGTATLGGRDLRGLHALADVAGRRFHRGVLLYFGEATIPFGDRVFAVPISRLWRTVAENRNSDEGRSLRQRARSTLYERPHREEGV